MEIREVKATEKIDECWDLLLAHRDELATHKDIMALKPDRAKYKAAEDSGCLVTLALYEGDTIVGYSVNMLTHAMHYQDLRMAMNDIIFVREDLRRGRWGIKLIAETERVVKERLGNVPVLMTFHGKVNTAFTAIMPRLGYGIQDIIFSKVL